MDTESFSKNKPGKFVRNTEGLWSFVPNDLPPIIEPTWELSSQISEADRKLSELAGTARTLPNPHLLIGPFSRREALLSSKIEGTIASLSDLLSYEALGTARNDKYAAVREVSNYVQALDSSRSRNRCNQSANERTAKEKRAIAIAIALFPLRILIPACWINLTDSIARARITTAHWIGIN